MDKDLKLKLRPFYLAQILYERTDEDHSLSTAELMEILENEYGIKTHRQRIPADVEVLRSFGMEIQEIMSSQKRYNLISREYDIAEIKLLIDAVESSKFITKKKSEELVAKPSAELAVKPAAAFPKALGELSAQRNTAHGARRKKDVAGRKPHVT